MNRVFGGEVEFSGSFSLEPENWEEAIEIAEFFGLPIVTIDGEKYLLEEHDTDN